MRMMGHRILEEEETEASTVYFGDVVEVFSWPFVCASEVQIASQNHTPSILDVAVWPSLARLHGKSHTFSAFWL